MHKEVTVFNGRIVRSDWWLKMPFHYSVITHFGVYFRTCQLSAFNLPSVTFKDIHYYAEGTNYFLITSPTLWLQPTRLNPDRLNVQCLRNVTCEWDARVINLTCHTLWLQSAWRISIHHGSYYPFGAGIIFFNFSTPVYKMWITQEPNILELWNRLHFEEKKKTERISHI